MKCKIVSSVNLLNGLRLDEFALYGKPLVETKVSESCGSLLPASLVDCKIEASR